MPPIRLTGKERKVLWLVAEGYTTEEIAVRELISVKTVKAHLYNIHAKLGARNRTQAVAIALRGGFIR